MAVLNDHQIHLFSWQELLAHNICNTSLAALSSLPIQAPAHMHHNIESGSTSSSFIRWRDVASDPIASQPLTPHSSPSHLGSTCSHVNINTNTHYYSTKPVFHPSHSSSSVGNPSLPQPIYIRSFILYLLFMHAVSEIEPVYATTDN